MSVKGWLGQGIAKNLIDTWLSDFPNNVLSNLGSAAPYEKTLAIRTVLEQLIKSWVDKVAHHSSYERSSNLNKLQKIAHLAPKDALDLVYTYLEALRHDPKESDYPNRDNYGPIVEIFGILPEFQVEALNLTKALADSGLGGTYDNYKIKTLTRNLVNPTIKGLYAIEVILKEIINWCNSSAISDTEAYMAAEAAIEVLASAHEHTETFGRTVTIGERIARDIPKVHQLRDLGMEIFKRLLYNNEHLRVAIEIADKIGDSRMHRVSPDEVPLAKRIRKDKDSALDLILQIDFNVLSPLAISDIENLALKLWLQNDVTDKSILILRKISRTPEYLFIKRYISPEHVISDLDELISKAPEENRWNWWWEFSCEARHEPSETDLNKLAEELNKIYNTADEIRDFLVNIEEIISPLNPWSNQPVVKLWVDKNPEAFLKILETESWGKIPLRFRGQITSAVIKHDKNYIARICTDVIGKLPNIEPADLQDLMLALRNNEVPYNNDIKECLLKVAMNGKLATRGFLVYELFHYFKQSKDGDSYIELIFEATHGQIDNIFADHLSYAIHTLGKYFNIKDVTKVNKLREKVVPMLVELPKLDYNALRILLFCLEKDIVKYIDFIEARIRITEAEPGKLSISEYEVVPYNGIKPLKEAINNQEDINKIISKILEWYRLEIFFSIEIRYLVKSIREATDTEGKLYLGKWVLDKLQTGTKANFDEVVTLASLGGFKHLEDEIWLNLLEAGDNLGSFDVAKSVFRSSLSRGGWIPEIYNQEREFCQRLEVKCKPGKIKSFLNNYIENINRKIVEHNKEDEEFDNPR